MLSLRSPNASGEQDEQEFLAGRGVVLSRVAMATGVSISQGIALAEKAVEILADEQNQPVFVHCAKGMHRAGAVVAAYRVSHCGWSEEEARTELLRYANDSESTDWACEVLREYCRRRRAEGDRHDDEVLDAVSE